MRSTSATRTAISGASTPATARGSSCTGRCGAPPWTPSTRIVEITDSAGRAVNLEYDSLGRLTSFTDAGGAVWTYTYDADDRITEVVDPLNRTVFEVVNDAEVHALSVRLFNATTTYEYQASQTIVTTSDDAEWVYEHDAQGTTTRVTAPDGGITALTRDPVTGDLTQAVDAEGGLHDFEHNDQHRITRYVGPSVGGLRSEWLFARDDAGRLLRVTPPAGGVTVFTYDDGQLIAEATDPNEDGTAEATTTYERDAQTGDVVASIDPEGRRTEYDYDAHGQLAAVRPPCLPRGMGDV